jgi:glycosyltransferase involved in cell wall biosynthesis
MTPAPIERQQDARSVLFLVNSLRVGGSERKAVRLANALALRGWSVALAYLGAPDTLLPQLRAEVASVDLQRRGKFSLHALRTLAALLRQRRVATLVAMNPYSSLYAVLAAALAGPLRPRVAASINTTDFVSRKEELQMLLYRHVLRRADLVVFGAERQRQKWCLRYRLDRSADRSMVLYNGVDTATFARSCVTPAVRPAPAGRVLLGTVGALRKEKAHTDLVQAVHQLSRSGADVGAIIVGEGPERPRIEGEIRRLGVEGRVTLLGEAQDVRPFLAAMDIFVLTSIAVETFSNAVLEAMAMSCPVVVADSGGMEEMLQFGGGSTYPSGDVQSLCNALLPLIADAGARTQLGATARAVVERHFSFEAMLRSFAERVLGEV